MEQKTIGNQSVLVLRIEQNKIKSMDGPSENLS